LTPKKHLANRRSKSSPILAIDIGGTKVAAALVNSSGKILFAARTKMAAHGTARQGLQSVFAAANSVLRSASLRRPACIGVALPGWVDSERGILFNATNIPCWRNYALAGKIAARYRSPVRVANDANAAALAEAAWGAGAGYESIFYVSLGTGIGSGYVVRNQLIAGPTGSAGEGGHMTINFLGPLCGCGKRGCIEMYASGTAIARFARQRLARASARIAGDLPRGRDATRITAESISHAAAAGNKLAAEILASAADHLAIWLGNIVDLLEPQAIIFGGGLAPALLRYRSRIRRGLRAWAINPRRAKVALLAARFGPDSALLGAAALCRER
jgi:glucokinase